MNRIPGSHVLWAAAAALLLSVTTATAHPPEFHEGEEQSEVRPWSRQEEASFLERMRTRHSLVAELGKLARQRAANPKLRAWGDSLSRIHTAEGKRIQAMLRTGYGVTTTAAPAAVPSLSKLKGAAFDQEVLSMMVRDLGQGLSESKGCEFMSMNFELRSACVTWTALQQKEVITAGGWLCEWFQKCE